MRRLLPDLLVRPAALRRRHRFAERFLLLVLALSTFGGMFTSSPPSTARADELDDAYERQDELEKLIEKQRASIKNLAASQTALSGKISDTKANLAEINANLLAVKIQIVGM